MNHELEEGRNQMSLSCSPLDPLRAWQSVSEWGKERTAGHVLNPKSWQRLKDHLDSFRNWSRWCGKPCRTYSAKRDPRTKSHFSASQGVQVPEGETLGGDLAEHTIDNHEDRTTQWKSPGGERGTGDRTSAAQRHPHRWVCPDGGRVQSKETHGEDGSSFLLLEFEKGCYNAAFII